MGPEGNILVKSSISIFQQGLTHSALLSDFRQVCIRFEMKGGFSRELWKVLDRQTTNVKSNVQIGRFLSHHELSPALQYPSVLICYNYPY